MTRPIAQEESDDGRFVLRESCPRDSDVIVRFSREVAEEGESYVFDAEMSDNEILAYWHPPVGKTFIAVMDGEAAGVYKILPNHIGRGSHIANAAYLVSAARRGEGIGRKMAEHSLMTARSAGFSAMQFNLVVATNDRAIALWRSVGFVTVGRIPKAFQHKTRGLVDAYIMHREI